MKKILLTTLLSAVLCAGSVFAEHPEAFGIGVQGGWSGGLGGSWGEGFGGGLTLKFEPLPIFWTVDVDWGSLAVAGDWYFLDYDFSEGVFGVYIGVGAYAGLGGFFGTRYSGIHVWAGGRLPIGLSLRLFDEVFEIYVQAVPSIGLGVIPSVGLWPNWIGGNLGIRLWFY